MPVQTSFVSRRQSRFSLSGTREKTIFRPVMSLRWPSASRIFASPEIRPPSMLVEKSRSNEIVNRASRGGRWLQPAGGVRRTWRYPAAKKIPPRRIEIDQNWLKKGEADEIDASARKARISPEKA